MHCHEYSNILIIVVTSISFGDFLMQNLTAYYMFWHYNTTLVPDITQTGVSFAILNI